MKPDFRIFVCFERTIEIRNGTRCGFLGGLNFGIFCGRI